jgi:hypothetical protein
MMSVESFSKKPPEEPRIWDIADEFLAPLVGKTITKEMLDATLIWSYTSCGVSVINGLNYTSPERIVYKVLKQRAATDRKLIREAFVVFSDTDNDRDRGGNSLCKYIKDNNLGTIMEMGPRMNPNSGNMIKIWVWAPPHESLSCKDKQMPVFGKKIVHYDGFSRYVDDPDYPRFHDTRGAQGA